MSSNVVEVIEEGSTVVEVVARGPQGPSGTGFGNAEIPAGGTNFNTFGNQIIRCNNTAPATVTLNPSAVDGEQLHIKRRKGAASVTIVGIVDGVSNEVIAPNGAAHLAFSAPENEWMLL